MNFMRNLELIIDFERGNFYVTFVWLNVLKFCIKHVYFYMINYWRKTHRNYYKSIFRKVFYNLFDLLSSGILENVITEISNIQVITTRKPIFFFKYRCHLRLSAIYYGKICGLPVGSPFAYFKNSKIEIRTIFVVSSILSFGVSTVGLSKFSLEDMFWWLCALFVNVFRTKGKHTPILLACNRSVWDFGKTFICYRKCNDTKSWEEQTKIDFFLLLGIRQ